MGKGKRTDFMKKYNLLVVGLGKTGVSVIKKVSDLCSSIIAVDDNPYLDLELAFGGSQYKEINNLKIMPGRDFTDGQKILKKIDLVIISPGVPSNAPLIKNARENGIPVWSELELAWRLLQEEEQKRTIAVTGTNGKTTVVTLIGEIIKNSGKNCVVCGNVGLPLINTIDTNEVNIINNDKTSSNYSIDRELIRVIEVSSFQLEWVYEFKPHISVILNITSDHIDRHRSFDDYARLKLKLFENQSAGDRAIFNADDPNIESRVNRCISTGYKKLPEFIKYSLKTKEGVNLFYEDEAVFYRIDNKKGKVNIKNSPLKGNHNISNIMASIAPSLLMGVDERNIEETIKNFKPLDHRLEYLGCVKKIRCFNDSKSTNPDATLAALEDFDKEVTLIMGGKNKNMDFSELISILNKKIKNLILIGEAAPVIYESISESGFDYKIFRCRTLEEAVYRGFEVAKPGEVLMLSPACASMDMFKDYKERGDRFKSLVCMEKERVSTGKN
ncbi:MAG: UDP-N-acetylmuramoyl-L-alanine--D-glutamate ligase [Actinomycetota bacterium]|nr:UDP-N-acetylmuramoyl-L-alanine--D-glutamate ligase [Actinomycetota bacterium]